MFHVQPDLDILFVTLTAEIEDRLHQKNTLCTLCLRGWRFYARLIFFCNILVLPSCNSDSWRRYTLKCLCCCVEGKVRELVQLGMKWGLPWGLLCGASGRRKLCMVPCHSCHTYGISRGKKVGDALKSLFRVAMQATRRENVYGKDGFSLCNTAVLKLYCTSYWVL